MFACGLGLDVLLDHLHAFDQNAVLVGDNAQHATGLAFALARYDNDPLVTTLDLQLGFLFGQGRLEFIRHYFSPVRLPSE